MKKNHACIGGAVGALMLCALYSPMQAQSRTVSGTVTRDGRPLPGVTVSAEGGPEATTTGSAGTYSLRLTGQPKALIFRHPQLGVRREEWDGRSTVNLNFDEKVSSIEEVVLNAGYYTVKEKERTGSIARVTAKDIQNQPVTNVLSAVQGRMAGVSITQNSGTAGGGYDIQIRGKNSLRREGNEPLYIIDGVPVVSESPSKLSGAILPYASVNPLNAINPNDIESIEVLKDADATAIYGSRGANGVVLVTTKKGKKGNLRLRLNSSYSLSNTARKLKMMDTDQYLRMRREAFANDGTTQYPATAYDVNGAWEAGRYTDWQRELTGNTAEASQTQASLSGGSDTSTFLLSYSHSKTGTVHPGDFKYKTNNLAGNFSHRSPDRKWELTTSTLFSDNSNNVPNGSMMQRALMLPPNAPALYNADGSLNWHDNTFDNPLAAFNATYDYTGRSFQNNFNVTYHISGNLDAKVNAGIGYRSFEEFSLRPHTLYNPAYGLTSEFSSAFKSNDNVLNYIVEPQLNWRQTRGKHKFDATAGATFQQTITERNSIVGFGFETNALIRNIGTARSLSVSSYSGEYNYAAVFGRLNYAYSGRYIVNLTGRRDGSSRFGPGKQFANFGALGAAWLFSEEIFFKGLPWFSFGKLRGSFGTTGSDKIGDFQYLNSYSTSDQIYDGITGLEPSRLYNPNFSWEKTTKVEAAVDLGFFDNRLNFTVARYQNRSSNQLVGIPLPATTGFGSVQANLDATVENSGWEIELAAAVFKKKPLTWNTNFNLSAPKNRLLSFPGLEGSTYANSYVIGQPTSMVKVYDYTGIDPATGLFTFRDFNNDGKITSPDDKQIVKNIGARFYGGWSNDFSYRNWQFSFLLHFVKQQNWNYNYSMSVPGAMNNQPIEVLNVWSQTNPSGAYMPYSSGANPQKNQLQAFFQNSTAAVSDASFVRLKNVQLSYRLPVDKKFVKESLVYLQGQNLLTLTKYFGVDPEFVLTGFAPPLKTYAVGLQLTF